MIERIIIYAIVIIFLVGMLFGCGCSSWRGHHKPESTIIEAPTPGVQLWETAKKSNWLVTMSILGIAAGVFALANGSAKLGTASIASASVSLFMTLAVSRFALWMAVFGLIGSVAATLFSILARRQALVDIIKGIQVYKDKNAHSISGLRVNETLANEQTPLTKKIVGDLKNQLKLSGEIT